MQNLKFTHSLSPVGEGLIRTDSHGVIKDCDENAAAIFGYSASDIIGTDISLIVGKTIFEKEKNIVVNTGSGSTKHYEAECKHKNGKKIFASVSTFPIKDDLAKVTGFVHLIKDISHQKLLDEKQATLAAIVNSSDDAIISKTLKGIITSWNRAAIAMFGFAEKEAIGKHISIIIPKDRIHEETVIISNIKKGKKIDHFETIRVAKDGTERHISLTVSPVKDRNGKIIGASKIARDISIRKEAETQRQLFTERLQELNKYKDEFMVMASHELKTPLTVVKANLQVLEMMLEADSRKQFIGKTITQVNKLSRLISDLLNVSKIHAGKLALDPELFDINVLIAEVVSNLQETTKDHHIIFQPCDPALMVNADRDKMEQVLTNLIGNAIKYMPEQGEIIIDAIKKGADIFVDVADSGIGIPSKDIESIFLRFYRVSGSASSFSGSGVGLYISSEIIKSHGGKMWAESEIGKGSVFHLSIPAAP